jgi:hypothetical protein
VIIRGTVDDPLMIAGERSTAHGPEKSQAEPAINRKRNALSHLHQPVKLHLTKGCKETAREGK